MGCVRYLGPVWLSNFSISLSTGGSPSPPPSTTPLHTLRMLRAKFSHSNNIQQHPTPLIRWCPCPTTNFTSVASASPHPTTSNDVQRHPPCFDSFAVVPLFASVPFATCLLGGFLRTAGALDEDLRTGAPDQELSSSLESTLLPRFSGLSMACLSLACLSSFFCCSSAIATCSNECMSAPAPMCVSAHRMLRSVLHNLSVHLPCLVSFLIFENC